MKRSLLASTLLLVVIGLFLEFWDSPPADFMKSTTTVTETPKASAYMNHTVTKHFSAEGSLTNILTSDRTDVFSRQKRYVLTSPHITSILPDQPPWRLSANRGVFTTRKEDKIVLAGKVTGTQKLDTGGSQQFKTSRITFFPDKKLAITDKKVTLTDPLQRLTATGLHADLKNQKYKLHSNIKGTLNAN